MKYRLLTPGPTAVPDGVLAELAEPVIHHRTKRFREIFVELSQRLQRVLGTEGPVLSIAGSGTAAFEAAQISLMGSEYPGRALTIAAGKFGERWQDIFDAYRVEQVRLNVPWGQAPAPDEVARTLAENPDIALVTLVASETSTSTACDLQAIAAVVRRTSALLIVDGITAVGAMPVAMDEWGIDALITASQKALMLPPGLGYVGLGPRAVQRLEQLSPAGSYFLDLRRYLASWRDDDVPFTPPVGLIRAQRVALEMIESQGLENVWQRTRRLAESSRAALQAMDLKLISQAPSDSVTGVFYPDQIDDTTFRARLREKHGVHIAGGQNGRGAKWKGQVMRISHMGHVSAEDTAVALTAIEAELIAAGCAIKRGTALEAAGPSLRD